uniref:DNA-directed RNA polymerase I subunit RPA43 n=1 Tax=Timema monikensis TaxID=170555 RepID=A0A7R9HM26_9NEOP|nr:unnamed protein product [Timema monikensis]
MDAPWHVRNVAPHRDLEMPTIKDHFWKLAQSFYDRLPIATNPRTFKKYDNPLKGILLGYENVKTQTSSGLILYDDSLIHIDIIADFYVFTPEVGCHLNGIVNKKSSTHIGCLVYKVFNVSIPNEDWVGQTVEIGQQVTFQVTVLDMTGRLPYIRGKLISRANVGIVNGASSIAVAVDTKERTSKLPTCGNCRPTWQLQSQKIFTRSQEESIDKEESNSHILKVKNKKIKNMEEEIQSNTESPQLATSVQTNKRKYEDDPISSLSKLEKKKKKQKRDHKDEEKNNVSHSINNIIESVNIELSTNLQGKDKTKERTELVGEMNDQEVYSKSKHKKNKHHHEKDEQQKAVKPLSILDTKDYLEENSDDKQIKVKQAPTQKHFSDSESNQGKTAYEHISVVTTDTHVKKKKKKKSKDRDSDLFTLTENMLGKLMNQPDRDSVQEDEVNLHKKKKKKKKKNMEMEQSVNDEQFCNPKPLVASSAGMREKDSEHELNDISSLHLSADPLAHLIGDKQEVKSGVNVPLTYNSPLYFNSSGMANAEDRKRKKSKRDLQKLQMISGILPRPSLKWMKQPSQSPSKNKLEPTISSPKTSTHRGQGIEGLSGFLSPSNTEIAVKIKSPSKQNSQESFNKAPPDPHDSSSSDSDNPVPPGTQTNLDSENDNSKLSSAGQHNHHKSTEKLSPRDVDNDISLKLFLKESPSKPESSVPPKADKNILDNPMSNHSDSDCIENSQPPIQSENKMEGTFHAKKRISLQLIKSKIDLLKEKPSDLEWSCRDKTSAPVPITAPELEDGGRISSFNNVVYTSP